MELFFSYSGRINRSMWWLGQAVLISIPIVLVFLVPWYMDNTATASQAISHLGSMLFLLFMVLVLMVWMNSALCVKRYHDLDKSGLWLLICLIPYIGAIWMVIELGFFKGTSGNNGYGDDPNGGQFDFDEMEAGIMRENGFAVQRPSAGAGISANPGGQSFASSRSAETATAPMRNTGGVPAFGKRGLT